MPTSHSWDNNIMARRHASKSCTCRIFLLHILFHPPENERLQLLMQLGVAALLGALAAVLLAEPLPVVELERHDEVEESPQLRQTVLQRSTGDLNKKNE